MTLDQLIASAQGAGFQVVEPDGMPINLPEREDARFERDVPQGDPEVADQDLLHQRVRVEFRELPDQGTGVVADVEVGGRQYRIVGDARNAAAFRRVLEIDTRIG
jgi:hypothetical protein